MENKILSAIIKSREAFDAVRDHVIPETFSPAGNTILKFVKKYYDNDPDVTYCDVDILRSMVDSNVASGAMQDQMQDVLSILDESEVSITNVVNHVLDKRRRDLGNELAQAILTASPQHEVHSLLQEYTAVLEQISLDIETDEEYNSPNLEELITDKYSDENLIPLAPKSLNVRLGNGVTKGRHIILAARPEVGKTAFSVNIACAAAHTGHKVMYYANEEPVVDIILRCVANMSGMSTQDIRKNPTRAQELASKRGFENIIFVYASRNSPWEVQALCKKHKPDLVIVDQIRNLNMRVDGLTELLERASKALRDISAQHNCVVLSITQAGDSAQNKVVLNMSDIDSSKTGIQGACDVLILVGKNEELDSTGRRCVTLAKNKVTGNHESFYININEQLSRITD